MALNDLKWDVTIAPKQSNYITHDKNSDFKKALLRQKPAIRGDICSESPPKVCEIDMAQGEDMSKGPGTEEIMFLSAFILEI